MTDTIADTLARIKNAVLRKKKNVLLMNTAMSRDIVEILKKEAFVENFEIVENEIEVTLKYVNNESLITNLERVSRPGQRIYVTKKEILPVLNGRGISIISTSKGVLTGSQAKAMGLGGEFICKIW